MSKEGTTMEARAFDETSTFADLDRHETLAIRLEVDDAHLLRARLDGLAVCGEPSVAYWLPTDRIDPRRLADLLRRKRLLFHDAKCALTVLERHGIDVESADLFDTMLAAHLLDENRSKDLGTLARALLDAPTPNDRTGDQLSLFERTPDRAESACAWAEITFRLAALLERQLRRWRTLSRFYDEIELPVLHVVRRMERRGIRLDVVHLRRVGEALRERIGALEQEIFRAAGGAFSVNSPVELAEVLFDRLALPSTRETRTGKRSVRHSALETLRDAHPIVPLLIEHRELTTLLTAYVDKLPELVLPETGRLHCTFHQVGTVTGRFSSSDPNLQAIPKDATIRSAFIPDDGDVLIDVDFSQVELRCAAHYARDPKMIEAFRNDIDLHRKVIADIAGKRIEDVTPEERALAKAVNFGLIYGMGPRSLARATGLTLRQAEAFIDAYFETYAGVRRSRREVLAYAEKHGQIINMFGRRRRFPNGDVRTAYNGLMQSTAADLCRLKMIALDAELPENVRMLLQVHDEILFEAPAAEADKAARQIVEIMERPITDAKGRPFRVPIRVEVGVGKNWGEAKV